MKVRFWITLVLFLGLVAMAIITSGAKLTDYLNIPSVIMVVVGALVLTFFSHTPSESIKAFTVAVKKDATAPELRDGDVFLSSFRRFLYLMGVIGFLTGIIAMLANLMDVSALGWGFALSLNTIWTALIVDSCIVSTLQLGVRRKLAALS